MQGVVLHQQNPLYFLREFLFKLAENVLELIAAGGFDGVTNGSHLKRCFAAVLAGDHMHRDMPGLGVVFEALQHRQAGPVGQAHIQKNRVRYKLRGQRETIFGPMRNQAVVTQLVRQVVEDF